MADRDSIRAYYDAVAGEYDIRHGVVLAGQAHNFARHYEPFLEQSVPRRGRVLEIGCGTGVYTRWLEGRGLEVVAMDVSPAMIAQARRRCPAVRFVEGDCADPAPALEAAGAGGAFDAVVGINTFSYYLDKVAALAAYRRLLAPGGRLVVIDMNGASPYYALMAALHVNELDQWYGVVRQSNRRRLERLLAASGFRPLAMTRFAFLPNALGGAWVTLLRPVDALFGVLPLGWLAMRIAYVAEAEAER